MADSIAEILKNEELKLRTGEDADQNEEDYVIPDLDPDLPPDEGPISVWNVHAHEEDDFEDYLDFALAAKKANETKH